MALAKELESLKEFQCPEGKCVLSVYLNTDRANQDQQKGEWKIRLKNGLKKLDEYLDSSGNEKQLKNYRKIKSKVEKEIQGNQTNLLKSVIIFGSEEGDLWSVHYLQLPVETSFHWESHPVVDQLEALAKQYPKSGIVLTNMDEVRILDTALGEVTDTRTYTFDPETENWSFKDGMGATNFVQSGASHVDKFQQRFEENMNRFYKDIAQNIDQMNRDREWNSVYLVGETEMTRTMESQLRVKVNKSVNKNLSNARPSQVLAQVFK
ncbi:VLRF1 family aeRF1-type release factor [Alteribacter aurantiacus]|uniref:VLRF1 family aeRF1-type release factor n=1 Tax=Alteribacter aurantiacus TaxID=254410 RepID=UPI0004104ACC|nr:VLRF1 family aeRF1-type release factor [Alteribacter aurantiacus]